MSSDFDSNIGRFTSASAYSLVLLTVAREMFGKSYFALGVQERSIVDTNVFQMVSANYQAITPQSLASQPAPAPAGFQPPAVSKPDPQKKP